MSKPHAGIPLRAKDSFWAAVTDCLVAFHQLSEAEARGRAEDLRARVENPPPGLRSDIFYHAEPFDVACDLAGVEMAVGQHQAEYDSILSRHNW